MARATAGSSWALEVQARPRALDVLIVVLVALALYAPYLGAEEFHHEEARRALPAREMLASGDYVLPTIWGKPYLAKPPFYYWCVAAVGAARGAIDEFATRLPALLASVATAVALLVLGARWFSRRAGWAAALIWLSSPAVFNKGALGELEALLALSVLGVTALLPAALAGSWRAALCAGLCLAVALLTKGPPAMIFVSAALLTLARITRAPGKKLALRTFFDARALTALGLGLGLTLLWVALLFTRLDLQSTLENWRTELDRTAGTDLAASMGMRLDFVTAMAGSVVATTLIAALVAGAPTWRALAAKPALQLCIGIVAVSLIALSISAPKHRYAYPLTPWLALLGGALLDGRCSLDAGRPAARAARVLACAIALAGLAMGAAALWSLFGTLPGSLHLDAIGWLIAAVGSAAGVFLLVRLRSAELCKLALAAFVVLAAVRGLMLTQYEQARTQQRGFESQAALFAAQVPADQPLYVTFWLHFNVLAYLDREVRLVEDTSAVPPGGYVLVVDPPHVPAQEAGFERLSEALMVDGTTTLLLRRQAAPDQR